jgi:shikimate dehydrogenase
LTISGATRVAGVIGDPVRHSLSPVLHNAAYRELALDWVYVAFEVPDGATRAALEAMRTLDLAGLSVTMPHKTAAAACCDELSDDAAALRSVNTVSVGSGGRLIGDSTDGEGFLRSLRDAGHDPTGAPVVLLGAGGAARAVARALGRAGARVVVCARKPDAAAVAAELAAGESRPWDDRSAAAAAATFVVNATPVGMDHADDLPLPLDALHPGQVLADLVYHPLETVLLRGARDRGAEIVDGLGMLVHQAALQIERWTGRPAPVAAMRAAAAAALRPALLPEPPSA